MPEDTGLLFISCEPGPNVTEEEFNDWCDNEQVPLRLTIEGIRSAARYKSTDGKSPSWLTLYDLSSPSVVKSESYESLNLKASAREKALVPRLGTFDGGVYKLIFSKSNPNPVLPGKYLFVVCMLVPLAIDEEFNKWYVEEHIPEFSKTPGWQRCRRYKLIDHFELTGKANLAKKIHNYLALHDFDNNDYNKTPEFVAAVTTPWTTKIRESVDDIDLRNFGLYRNIEES